MKTPSKARRAPPGNRSLQFLPGLLAVASLFGAGPVYAVDTLVPLGAVWRYLDNASDAGTAWRGTNFVDTSWASGPGQLGFGDGDEATIINGGPSGGRYPTTYFRHTFVVTNRASLTNLALRLLRDDGAIVYLNGVEVFRSNMPEAPPAYNTWAAVSVSGSEENTFFPAAILPALLLSGTNVIAAEIHQDSPSSSDLSFNLELLANTPLGNLPPAATVTIAPAAGIFGAGEAFTVSVTASDVETTVNRIDVLQDGVAVRTFLAASGTFVWSNTVPGIHEFTARATDVTGIMGLSAPVRVLITPPGFQAQSAFYPQFPSGSGLVLQNDANTSANILHLMRPNGTGRGAAWMAAPQGVVDGFVTEFRFRVICKVGGGADGFALVIAGTPQPVFGSGGISYNNITNSLAVEFDTWMNSSDGDPDDHHIAVHSRGALGNTQNESASLGLYTPGSDFSDGAVHRVRISYAPGNFLVFLDNLNTPVLNLNLNLSTLLSLPNRTAWIGLTGGSGASSEYHDFWAWSYTSFANVPPVVSLTSPPKAIRAAPGTDLTLTAEASDPNGSVLAVGFSIDGTFLDEGVETPPFSLVWSNLPPGIHAVRAAAVDNEDALGLSAPPVVVEVVPTNAVITLLSDFNGASNLVLQGSATLLTNRLRLTPALPSQTGGAWLDRRQSVQDGFETVFQFQISQPSSKGADGLAFVIAGDASPLLGGAGTGLGYSSIPNSLAVEFDTFQNSEVSDPDANHIGVHSRGLQPNSADESAALARVAPTNDLSDGAVHTAVVRYSGSGSVLRIYLDDLSTPVLTKVLNLGSLLNLENGTAWVGLTAATGGEFENHDLLMWSFRPNAAPLIQLTAPDAGPLLLPTDLTISASANDGDGDISGVTFFVNSNSVGTVTTPPFSITWSNAAAGTYSLTAVAYDDLGAATRSLPLTVSLVELRLQNQARPTNGSMTLAFSTLTNRSYTIQYSADLAHWTNAVPSLTGDGAIVQWQDTGPPVTDGDPAAQSQRFYRIVSP